jgi:hypothetical protein
MPVDTVRTCTEIELGSTSPEAVGYRSAPPPLAVSLYTLVWMA